jgi:hypothetical protein
MGISKTVYRCVRYLGHLGASERQLLGVGRLPHG